MSESNHRLGFSASLACLAAMALYPVFFLVILKTRGLFLWTNIRDLAAWELGGGNLCKYAAMAFMILFACAYCVIPLCLKAENRPRPFADLSALFGLAFCVCCSVSYFVQLTATRLQLQSGITEGLEQLTQANSLSAINAVNMLGWTLFFPLSTLALAPLFGRSRGGTLCRVFCVANSAVLFLALAAYAANNTPLLMLTMYPGLGLTSIGLSLCFLTHFKAALRSAPVCPGQRED